MDQINPEVRCDGCGRTLRERDTMLYKKKRVCAGCL